MLTYAVVRLPIRNEAACLGKALGSGQTCLPDFAQLLYFGWMSR
jgi:hypothetical protein